LQTLQIDKSKAIYVGDSEVDIQTAQNAGIPCISVTWGFKDKEFLVKNGGEIFAETAKELLAYCIR
jgi:phosphoglycolate phosphatase